jgi:hypothetical protein
VEFEDTSTFSRFQRIGKIDSIDDANEPNTERDALRERSKYVAKEAHSRGRIQLGCDYFFFPVAHRDGRVARSAKVAYPIDVAPWSPDPAPA